MPRIETDLVATTSVAHSTAQQVVAAGPTGHVVRNSPYGANRILYGWGDLFRPGIPAIVPQWPNIHIGLSSLNAVPGKDRSMKTLMRMYQKKFNCLEHCYTFHSVSDVGMWHSWRNLALTPLDSVFSTSFLSRKECESHDVKGGAVDAPRKRAASAKRSREGCDEKGVNGAEVPLSHGDEAGHCADDGENLPPFMYTIKSNRYLTHNRMLALDEATEKHITEFFTKRCPLLGRTLGPVLLQLPPNFERTSEHVTRIEAVAACLPPNIRVAVEFRHSSWYVEETRVLLRRVQWAQVVVHHHDTPLGSVHVDTGVPFMYVRMHGPLGRNVGDYGPVLLSLWARRIAEFVRADHNGNGEAGANVVQPRREVFFFFNNSDSHVSGTTSSVVDATWLAEKVGQLLSERCGTVKVVDYVDVGSSCSEDYDCGAGEVLTLSD